MWDELGCVARWVEGESEMDLVELIWSLVIPANKGKVTLHIAIGCRATNRLEPDAIVHCDGAAGGAAIKW